MKATFFLTVITALAVKINAASEDCFSLKLGYQCCSPDNQKIIYFDNDGDWGVEKGKWCGISPADSSACWARKLNYKCCINTSDVVYIDEDGKWGIEKGKWCGIIDSPVIKSTSTTTTTTTSTPSPTPRPRNPGNPFAIGEFYLNPYYVDEVDKAITQITDSSLKAKAEKMKNYANAIWLDSIDNMNNWLEINLKGALLQQQSFNKNVLTVFVLYDLPGRNCHALVSAGELVTNDSDMERYKTEYIDVIESTLKKYNNQVVVLIIEPNSLVNMVFNVETTPACADAEKYYMDGHAYLIKKLGVLPHVAMYIDVGHAFWLGWDDYREKAVKMFYYVIKSGAPGRIRGFADNIADYIPWEDPVATGPDNEFNPCPDEKRYLKALYIDFKSANIQDVHFVSDTSRNGNNIDSYHVDNICIVNEIGVGARPQANPIPEMDYVDAFFWIKPLGEVDDYCMHEIKDPWVQRQFIQGITNANPPL